MAAMDFASLKAYVSGGGPRNVSAATVLMDVQHNLIQQRFVEIPFDIHQSITSVKDKIYTLCGTSPQYQRLYLNGPSGTILADDNRTLASYGVNGNPGQPWLYVEDMDPYALGRSGGLHDVTQVKKYVMSDEDYAKRSNTYRAFKQQQKSTNPEWKSIYEKKGKGNKDDETTTTQTETNTQILARITVGARCQIQPGERRGTIKYVGPVPELSPAPLPPNPDKVKDDGTAAIEYPLWVGVALDEPLGKHDGMIANHRYFTCQPKHGTLLKPMHVTCGDFPEQDPFEDDEEEDNEKEEEADAKKTDKDISHTNAESTASGAAVDIYEEL